MITSTIKFSQIEDRIDAEYYKPEFFRIYEILGDKQSVRLEEVAEKLVNGGTPGIGEGKFYEKGVLFLKNGNIKEMEIDYDNVEFISRPSYAARKRSALKKNDVLVTIAGTIGNVAVFDKNIEANINQNVCRVVTKNINPYYLAIFLNSKIGKSQLIRHATVQTIQYINNQILGDVKIPIPSQSFQQKIEKMVKEAQEKRKLADEKYKEAEEILNKELRLEDLDLSTQKTFTAKFSEAEDRFDPEYYQPKYKKINSKLKSQKSKLLNEIVKIRKGIEVGHEAYTNDGKPFIRVQDYDEKELIISGSTNYIRPYLYEELKKTHKPVVGEIIYSKDGTVGRAFVVSKDNHEFIVSGGILILTPRDVDNYYLALVLNSEIVHSQAIRKSIGAIIQHLSVEEVKKLQIPILPQSTQQKVSSLIQESFKLRQEAKELINRAKQKVEELIEK